MSNNQVKPVLPSDLKTVFTLYYLAVRDLLYFRERLEKLCETYDCTIEQVTDLMLGTKKDGQS